MTDLGFVNLAILLVSLVSAAIVFGLPHILIVAIILFFAGVVVVHGWRAEESGV